MLLEHKNAVIYGAGGAIGGAVSRAFASEGAQIFMAGRSAATVKPLADDINARFGREACLVSEVDVRDDAAVAAHFAEVVTAAPGQKVDISFNAISVPQRGIQAIPLIQQTPDAFTGPVTAYARAFFITATAAGRHMAGRGSGVILTLTAAPSRMAAPLIGGMGPAWAAVESFTRDLAAELGPSGVRVLGLRPDGIPGTPILDSVYELHAAAKGSTPAEILAYQESKTLLGRKPTLWEVAHTAAFLASDAAGAMTGTIVNVSCGSVVD